MGKKKRTVNSQARPTAPYNLGQGDVRPEDPFAPVAAAPVTGHPSFTSSSPPRADSTSLHGTIIAGGGSSRSSSEEASTEDLQEDDLPMSEQDDDNDLPTPVVASVEMQRVTRSGRSEIPDSNDDVDMSEDAGPAVSDSRKSATWKAGEWYTFRAKEAADEEWMTSQRVRIVTAMGRDMYRELEAAGQLPITMEKRDVGIFCMPAELVDGNGNLRELAPSYSMRVQIWVSRMTSIDGQQPGWQRFKKGVVLLGMMVLGVPFRKPISIDLPMANISRATIQKATGTIFAQTLDAFMQTVAHNAKGFPSTSSADPSTVSLFKDEMSRKMIIEEILTGTRNAKSLDLLKDSPLEPDEAWNTATQVDCQQEFPAGTQHIYAIRERAIFPVGASIRAGRVVLSDGHEVEDSEILGLHDMSATSHEQFIYGCYEGVTGDLPSCTKQHTYGITKVDPSCRHYRVSRVLARFTGYEFRFFRLVTLPSTSPLLLLSGGRHIAEQLMISYNNTYNDNLRRQANHFPDRALGDATFHFVSCTARDVSWADSLGRCMEAGIETVHPGGFRARRTLVVGQNFESPLANCVSWMKMPWSAHPIFNEKDEVCRYIFPREHPCRVTKSYDSAGTPFWTIEPRPGPFRYRLHPHESFPSNEEGFSAIITYELCCDGEGPHPFPLLPLPMPGPIDYYWRRTQDLSLQVQFLGADGKVYLQYLTCESGCLRQDLPADISPAGRALGNLPLQVDAAMSTIAHLLSWRWQGSKRPDFLTRTTGKSRIHVIRFDFLTRTFRLQSMPRPVMPQPALVGGTSEIGRETISANHSHLQQLVDMPIDRPDAELIKTSMKIGNNTRSSSHWCERALGLPSDRDEAALYESREETLLDGTKTRVCKRCLEFGHECVFVHSDSQEEAGRYRDVAPGWSAIMGVAKPPRSERMFEIEGRAHLKEALARAPLVDVGNNDDDGAGSEADDDEL